jgi:predicted membrane protein
MTPDPHGDRDPRHSWPLPGSGEQRPREVFSTRLIVGVLIMLLGGTLLADNLGWIEARHVLRSLWPLVMVAIGVAMVRRPQHRRSREGGWVLITVGIWIFLSKLGWVHVSLGQLLLPGIFLFVGGVLVFRSLRGPDDSVPKSQSGESTGADTAAAAADHAEFVRSFAMLSGVELRPVSRPFRGADLSAVMGGIKLDLASARMEGDTAVIEVFAFWGGVEIYVPPDWTVTSEVTTLLAGFIDKRRPTTVVPTKNLVIKGMIVMSGVEIKN